MFNLVKTCVVLALLIGVVVLGVKLHRKATENGTAVSAEAKKIADEIKKIAKDAVKETETLQKAYTVNDPSAKSTKEVQDESEVKGAKNEKSPAPALHPEQENRISESKLQPLDEEDRVLTEEILTEHFENGKEKSDPAELNEVYAAASVSEPQLTYNEAAEPFDFNRLTEVRNIYLEALEMLDLK